MNRNRLRLGIEALDGILERFFCFGFLPTLFLLAFILPMFYFAADQVFAEERCVEVIVWEKKYVPKKTRFSEKHLIVFEYGGKMKAQETDEATFIIAKVAEPIRLLVKTGRWSGILFGAEYAARRCDDG